MKLIIAAPANGMELKNTLQARLAADPRISSLRDMSTDTSYPQLSFAVAQAVAAGEAERAILICGTGIGTAIACAAQWKTTTRKSCAWGKTSSPPLPHGHWWTSGSTCATTHTAATPPKCTKSARLNSKNKPSKCFSGCLNIQGSLKPTRSYPRKTPSPAPHPNQKNAPGQSCDRAQCPDAP